MLDSAILERGITRLDERFGLDPLWLFGSEARGSATTDADIDRTLAAAEIALARVGADPS